MADPKYDLVTTVRAEDEFTAPLQKMADMQQDLAADAEMNLSRFDRALGKVGLAYGRLAEVSEEAIAKVSRQTSTGAKEIGLIAKQIVDSVQQTGNIDLGLERIEKQVNAAKISLATYEDMRAQQVRLQGSTEAVTAADKLRLATLDQSIEKARQNIIVLETTSGAMQRMQADLRANGGALAEFTAQQQRTSAVSGQTRAGLQQLSYQLNDVAVQYAAGTPPAQIFAQQSGQVAQAVGLIAAESKNTTGTLGKMAGFMGGPWGIAITSAAVVLSPFIAKLFDTGDAADTAAAKLRNAAQAARELIGADNALKLNNAKTAVNKLTEEKLTLETTTIGPGMGEAGRASSQAAQRNRDRRLLQIEQEMLRQNSVISLAEEMNADLEKRPTAIGRSASPRSSRSGSGGSGGGRTSSVKSIPAVDQLESGMAALRELKKEMQATGLFASMAETSDATRQIRADDAPVTQDIAKLNAGFDALHEQSEKLRKDSEVITVQVAKSFGDMAEGVIDALDRMSSSIRCGDFLSILSGVMNLGLKLGGAGLFGEKVQTNINSVQKKAAGGRIFGPGTGTSDCVPLWASHGEYIVNARSTAQFLPALEAINAGRIPKLAKGGLVTPSLPASMRRGVGSSGNAGGGGQMQVQVLPSKYFDVHVMQGVASAAPAIVEAGAQGGFNRVAKAGARSLGR